MRNLGLIVALWLSALLPTNSLALGLGEIEVNSFLNQPLSAEIEVISARPGEIDDLLVSLASREAFARAGLSRPRHLLDLRFSVKKNEEGDEAVIVVTTKAGIKEPFLNFLIEADWSKGRVLREFTVLLDPPFFADQPAPVETAESTPEPVEQPISDDTSVSEIVEQAGVTTSEAAEVTEPADSGQQITEPIALSEDSASAESGDTEPASDSFVMQPAQNIIDDDVLVVKGDTLWGIASRFKDDAHSMAQVMLAFQRVNPDAFADGNINNMKEGAILRAPSMDDIDAIGQQEAYAEVLTQNGLWDDYVARVTGVSPAMASEETETEMVAADEDVSEESGELSLLLPGDGDSESTGTGDTGDVNDLRTKLALAEEELEASRIENQELESRITELQARLSKVEELQKMVEIEDDSLAQMQTEQVAEPVEEVAEVVEQIEEELETASETVSEAIQADEEALLEELLAEEAAAQAEEQAAIDGSGSDEMVDDEAPSDEMVSDEALSEDTMDESMAEDTMAEDTVMEPADSESGTVVTPPAPVIVTPPVARQPSIFDGILPPNIIDMIPSMPSMSGLFGDPIILGAVGVLIVLLLVLVVLKRRKSGEDDDDGITVSGDDDLFAGEDEEELTPIHLADGFEPEETDIKVPTEDDIAPAAAVDAVEQLEEVADAAEAVDELGATAVISATDMPEPEAPAPTAESAEQDDVLNEVDVYLAYGLYDNAEELLNSNLTENPERADYRSKLLDTYFATKNADAFVKEAEKLKSMGDVATRYWDRVQIMGYELVPDNALFSEAKDSGLSAADLEITKPQEADFDLGASEDDDTNFSTTDFNLGEEDTGGDFNDTANMGEAGDIAATQQIPQIDELPELSDEDDTNLRDNEAPQEETGLELPDDIGDELEFSMDAGDNQATAVLELPDEFELDDDDALDDAGVDLDVDDMAMDFDIDAGEVEDAPVDDELGAALDTSLDDVEDIGLDEDALELGLPDDDEGMTDTAIVTPNYEDTEVVPQMATSDDEDTSEIDLGMEDTAMMQEDETSLATSELNLDTAELKLPGEDDDFDDDEDISIIDFGGEDFVEPTDVIESVDDDDSIVTDEDGEEVKTGTFAPGDFEEPTAATESLADIDDIGDLMLPDDVDEVSTKLDLARAFIDMGDTEGARGSLEEVMSEGNEEQKTEAKSLLDQI